MAEGVSQTPAQCLQPAVTLPPQVGRPLPVVFRAGAEMGGGCRGGHQLGIRWTQDSSSCQGPAGSWGRCSWAGREGSAIPQGPPLGTGRP